MSDITVETPKRTKANHVGAPAVFALEMALRIVNEAFGECGYGCYLVGSALSRPGWRDVDIRFIMKDDEFEKLFPDAGDNWEFDSRWLLMTIAISERLSKLTGLPIDFQFQKQTPTNERHKGERSAMGLKIGRPIAGGSE